MTTAAWIAVSFILGVIVGLVLAALMGWPDNAAGKAPAR